MTESAGPGDLPAAVVHGLISRGLTVATAESLTAGLLAATLAEVPGASGTLQGGVIAYQNHVKQDLLGVDADLLARHGAVHPEVARQMAEGARRTAGADLGISTTGVAGPEPHQGQPVGTVYVGLAGPAGSEAIRLRVDGDREAIRRATVREALLAVRGRWA
ncbi:CinA family protein [Citricoccus nitrophenolicus]|uniref:CinA family protein n=1 Tax=Citricoccus nitrophenolicus TaxID=863575 RepID=A0ABV0IGD7_9MICC|nr:CinA family protein [Citricoccus sp. I39-566]WMY76898.1 CinA family protein [Citricoccus sp. I39-566]